MHRSKRVTPYLYLLPIIILFGILLVYPIITVIGYSFQNSVITKPDSEFVEFKHYAKVLSESKFWTAFRNSVEFSLLSMLFHLILGMMFALMLNSKLITMISILTGGGPAKSTSLVSVTIYQTAFGSFKFGLAGAMVVIVFVICYLFGVLYRRLSHES